MLQASSSTIPLQGGLWGQRFGQVLAFRLDDRRALPAQSRCEGGLHPRGAAPGMGRRPFTNSASSSPLSEANRCSESGTVRRSYLTRTKCLAFAGDHIRNELTDSRTRGYSLRYLADRSVSQTPTDNCGRTRPCNPRIRLHTSSLSRD